MPTFTGPRFCLLSIALALLGCYAYAQSMSPPLQPSHTIFDWSGAEVFTVVMSDYVFAPDCLTLRHAVPTRLRLVNRGTQIHDFTAAHFFKTVDLRDPDVLGSSGIGIPVEPQQQKEVDLIARMQGSFGLICADHDWAGMTANILVE